MKEITSCEACRFSPCGSTRCGVHIGTTQGDRLCRPARMGEVTLDSPQFQAEVPIEKSHPGTRPVFATGQELAEGLKKRHTLGVSGSVNTTVGQIARWLEGKGGR